MDWKYLLTSFDGRINRAKFWAAIGVFIALGVIGLILDSMLGTRIDARQWRTARHRRADHLDRVDLFRARRLCQALARPRQVGLVDADHPRAVHRRHLVHRRMRHSRRHQGRQQIRSGSACLTENSSFGSSSASGDASARRSISSPGCWCSSCKRSRSTASRWCRRRAPQRKVGRWRCSLALLVSAWANLALTAKRLHDFDKPAAWALVTLVIGFIVFIVLCPGEGRSRAEPIRHATQRAGLSRWPRAPVTSEMHYRTLDPAADHRHRRAAAGAHRRALSRFRTAQGGDRAGVAVARSGRERACSWRSRSGGCAS